MVAVKILESLSSSDRAMLDRHSEISTYRSGEMLVSHLDEQSSVFIVHTGLARVTIFSQQGRPVTYRDIGAGAIFGELAAIDDAPRSAAVTAVDDVTAAKLSPSDFKHMMDTAETFRWAVMRHLSGEVRRMTNRIFEFSTLSVRERLISELLRLADEAGFQTGRAEVKPALTHFDLATRISSHREAVSRAMSELSKQGLISKSSGTWVLENLDSLRESLPTG
jgi:CRP-like cAMP-binding protein